MRIHVAYRLCGALCLGLSALYSACALFLFHRSMPSLWLYSSELTHSTWHTHVAATLLYCLGSAAWCLVAMCLYGAYCFIKNYSLKSEWDRIAAWIVVSVSMAALSYIYHIDDSARVYVPGGFIGLRTASFLLSMWGAYLTKIFLCTCMIASWIILTRWCYMSLIHIAVVHAQRALTYAYEQRWVQRIAKCMQAACISMLRCIRYGMHALWQVLNGKAVHEAGMTTPDDAQSTYEALRTLALSLEKMENAQVPEQTLFPLHEKTYTHAEINNPSIKNTAPPTVCADDIIKIVDKKEVDASYVLPGLDIFVASNDMRMQDLLIKELEVKAQLLEQKLQRFGVIGKVTSIKAGPVVTLYEYQPDIDIKISKIVALEDDLALALQALSIRIIAPIPGRSVVGFEVANGQPQAVLLSKVLHSDAFRSFNGSLPLALGVDTVGESVLVDLARMPHLLIAGSTGSGKSVALNAMLTSLLCRCTPDEMKLILIDPKRLEFAAYADIAHLLFPIVTDPRRAAPVLRWVVKQMEQRYELMAEHGVRTVKDYNAQVASGALRGERVPFIVVIIDELADLMMTAGRDVEDSIARIAQMARAAGIHLIVATQRPSVDVITGLIKVNFPSRISFRVTSRVDSRTILDTGGAEKLLGRGDLLFLDSTAASLRRLHGAYVSDAEINSMIEHIRRESPPAYLDLSQEFMTDEVVADVDVELYEQVLTFLDNVEEVSISLLQREFRIGYNRSARIIDQLEKQGLLMPPEGSKPRKVVR